MIINFKDDLPNSRFGYTVIEAIQDSLNHLKSSFKNAAEIQVTVQIVLNAIGDDPISLDNNPLFGELSDNDDLQNNIRSLIDHLDASDKISLSYVKSSPPLFMPNKIKSNDSSDNSEDKVLSQDKKNHYAVLLYQLNDDEQTEKDIKDAYIAMVKASIKTEINALAEENPETVVASSLAQPDKAKARDEINKQIKGAQEKGNHVTAIPLVQAIGSYQRYQKILELIKARPGFKGAQLKPKGLTIAYSDEEGIEWELMWVVDDKAKHHIYLKNTQDYQRECFDNVCHEGVVDRMYPRMLSGAIVGQLSVESIYEVFDKTVAALELEVFAIGYINTKNGFTDKEKEEADEMLDVGQLLNKTDQNQIIDYLNEHLEFTRTFLSEYTPMIDPALVEAISNQIQYYAQSLTGIFLDDPLYSDTPPVRFSLLSGSEMDSSEDQNLREDNSAESEPESVDSVPPSPIASRTRSASRANKKR